MQTRQVARSVVLGLLVGCAGSQMARSTAAESTTGTVTRTASGDKPEPIVIPTVFDEDRMFARPIVGTETLDIYLDTGGNNVLYSDVAKRLGLQPIPCGEGGEKWQEVNLPAFSPQASVPLPITREGRVLVLDRSDMWETNWSGILGPEWFGGRVWTFDYPGQKLLMHQAGGDAPHGDPTHTVSLGFQDGLFFPRIQVSVDGETLDLLFDTGAQTKLTDDALAKVSDGRRAVRATSFIANAVFEKWRKAHPEWRVVEKAEVGTGEAMIEVPSITVAGHMVGPVWFTRRADKNFHEFMSQFMDKRIDGALGGNALRTFRITVDYPRAVAMFEKP